MTVDKSRIISLADKIFSIFLNANCTEMQMMRFISNWEKSYKNQKMNQSILSKLPFLKIIEYDFEYDDDSEDDKDNYSSTISMDSNAHEIKTKSAKSKLTQNQTQNLQQQMSPLIIVNIEQDDCCKFCKGNDCTLIHILSKNNYCSEFEKSGHCSNFQCKLFHRPNIKLIQRLIDCFKSKELQTLKLTELISIHNETFPQFISHSPTPCGIKIRCNTKFECKSDDDATSSNEFIIDWKGLYINDNLQKMHQNRQKRVERKFISPKSYSSPWHSQRQRTPTSDLYSDDSMHSNSKPMKKQPIIPEQTEMFKIYMKLEKEWIDNQLIKELLQHFKKHSNIPIQDMYIPRRNRSGFVTFQHKSEAAKFMMKVNSPNPSIKCGGRTISVRKPTKQNVGNSGSIKLHIQNIGCCVSFPQFVVWCRQAIETEAIYNLQLVNNTVTEGAGYAILCIDNEKDGKEFMKDLDCKEFRNAILSMSQWIQPTEYKKNLHQQHFNFNNNSGSRFKTNNSRFKQRAYSISHTQNGNTNGNDLGDIWNTSPSRMMRRHSQPMTALSVMMNEVDLDFKERKTRSRLHKRHSLASSQTLTANKSESKEDIKSDITFKQWLCDVAKCGEYYDKFINAGFDSMDEMDRSLVTHDVLKEVGIDKIGHRVKILKAIDHFRSAINGSS